MKRARHGEQPRIPLFTFLDVLICTMGALIVLLSLLVARAKEQASINADEAVAAKAAATSAVDPDELKQLEENETDLKWRAGVLKEQHDQFAKELANQRLALAHLEDHIRRLEDQARAMMAQAEELKKLDGNRLADQETARQQLVDMEREIKEKKDELEKARKEALRRRPAYAIVPYDGPNGTSRRPMYIECTEEGVILQPEGIRLTAKDFQGPQGPGNPLDAALRAMREHWQAHGLKGEPYPLIVVRPNGAIAFGAARSAMKHWESEFGYELVDQDAELKFPPPDRQLAGTLQRAIDDARQRQLAFAAAMPNRFKSEGQLTSFRAADNVDPDQFADGTGNGNGGVGGSGQSGVPSFAKGGTGKGTGPRGATGTGGSGMSGTAESIGGPAGNGLRTPVGTYAKAGNYGTGTGTGPAGNNGNPGGSANGSNQKGSNQAQGGSPTGTSQSGSAGGKGNPSGNPSSASSTSSGAASGTSSSGSTSGRPGMSGSGAGSPSSGDSSNGMGTPSINVDLTPQQRAENSPQMQKVRKAIKKRGENWGLPNASPKATAVVRPIYMECYADRLLLLPDRGDVRTPLVVPVEDDLTRNLDAVVGAVWQRMDRWGLAVLGGYWKPVLTIDVKAGGEERFEELRQLLQGSGIEVERKSP